MIYELQVRKVVCVDVVITQDTSVKSNNPIETCFFLEHHVIKEILFNMKFLKHGCY